jgi:hypothetical protein
MLEIMRVRHPHNKSTEKILKRRCFSASSIKVHDFSEFSHKESNKVEIQKKLRRKAQKKILVIFG